MEPPLVRIADFHRTVTLSLCLPIGMKMTPVVKFAKPCCFNTTSHATIYLVSLEHLNVVGHWAAFNVQPFQQSFKVSMRQQAVVRDGGRGGWGGGRDLTVKEAVELGRRAIYHATFRDAVSGGTVSGNGLSLFLPERCCSGRVYSSSTAAPNHSRDLPRLRR